MTAPPTERIVSLDPGRHTGVCFYEAGRLNPYTAVWDHEKLYQFLIESEPKVIVYERFDYRPHQPMVDLFPIELIGVIQLYGLHTQCKLVPQPQLKGHGGFWTDEKLRTLELYRTGEGGHSNDAIRQLLYYITFDLCNPYYVEKFGGVTASF